MAEDRSKPGRPWREIAEEVSTERDSDKVAELSQELIQALDKENKQSRPTTRRDVDHVCRKAA